MRSRSSSVFPYIDLAKWDSMSAEERQAVAVERRFAGNLNAMGRADIVNPTRGELEVEGWLDEAQRSIAAAADSTRHPGEVAREDALRRVEESADPEWMQETLNVINVIASRRERLTTDHVWKALAAAEVPAPRESRAMGSLMRKAASKGWIVAEDEWELSDRPECHRRPVRVWRSKLVL